MKKVTKENYHKLREELVEKNLNLVGVVLREDEMKLDKTLRQMKREYYEICGGVIPYDMPVLYDDRIWNSRLYDFCRRLPKGSDLHVHGIATLPAHRLVDFLYKRDEMYVYAGAYGSTPLGTLLYGAGENIPAGYVTVKDAIDGGFLSREKLIEIWTVMACSKEENIWKFFEDVFEKHAALESNFDFLEDYYVESFRTYAECNIMHIELHELFMDDNDGNIKMAMAIRNAYYKVREEYPDFIVSIIGAGLKNPEFSVDFAKECFINTQYVRDRIKDDFDPLDVSEFIIGFDLINEEDASRPLKEFAPAILEVKEQYPDLKLYMHCGESLDASSDNLIDAYLLGVSRVGHGMNLYRYPELLKRFAEKEICLEVCPISNQTLRYTTDIRVHPATEYLKRNIAVSLCSDDPSYQAHEPLVDDFFAALVGWNIGLADVKQLCLNSIMYSGVDDKQRLRMLRAWKKEWNRFVEEMIKE